LAGQPSVSVRLIPKPCPEPCEDLVRTRDDRDWK